MPPPGEGVPGHPTAGEGVPSIYCGADTTLAREAFGNVSWSLVKISFLFVALVVAGGLQTPTPSPDPLAQRTKGKASAPVTVYEMADFQCPACRLFTVTILPTIDSEYIQTGKVRWVFINLPLASLHANAMLAAQVAMCAAHQGRFWPTHDAFYQHQDDWAKLPDAQARAALVGLAQRAGADRAKLQTCIDDPSVRNDIEFDAQRAQRSGAHATPTFYIEGGLLEGAPYTPDPMRHVLDSIYAAKTR